jgi:phosphatidylserine/phosphatidylglycerophosphate/cardiolipin synthase-like enzyme
VKQAGTKIVVSGSTWMGSGLGSVESALLRLFEEANEEVLIVAYAVSSGAAMLFEQLSALLSRGVRVNIITNRFADQPVDVQRTLQHLQRSFAPLLQLFSFDPENDQSDLHAKLIVVDRQQALVGSANLSLRGLQTNHELSVVVTGSAAAEIARAVDLLMRSPRTTSVHSTKA